jgi:hypothetical protein
MLSKPQQQSPITLKNGHCVMWMDKRNQMLAKFIRPIYLGLRVSKIADPAMLDDTPPFVLMREKVTEADCSSLVADRTMAPQFWPDLPLKEAVVISYISPCHQMQLSVLNGPFL